MNKQQQNNPKPPKTCSCYCQHLSFGNEGRFRECTLSFQLPIRMLEWKMTEVVWVSCVEYWFTSNFYLLVCVCVWGETQLLISFSTSMHNLPSLRCWWLGWCAK